MRWIVLFHLWLSAVLSVQQPCVLVRAEREAARAADARAASMPWSEDEDEVPALRSGIQQELKALSQVPHEPVPSRARAHARWEGVQKAPRRCDTARCHWRTVQLLPLGLFEGEPPEAA